MTGRKVCTGCGWRLAIDFTRRSDGTLHSRCRTCDRIENRITLAKMKGRDEPYKARQVVSNETKRKRANARSRRRNRTQERREYMRMYAADKRRQAGIEPRNFKRPPRTLDGDHYSEHTRDLVDSAPFIAWLKEQRIAVNELARLMSVDRKRIQLFVNDDPPQHVTLGFVDRAMHAVGQDGEMWTLYPD